MSLAAVTTAARMPAMSDDATLTATPSSAATDAAVLTRRCPWCSEVLPADAPVSDAPTAEAATAPVVTTDEPRPN